MKPTKHARHKLVRVREFMLYKRKTSKFVRRFTFCTWIFTLDILPRLKTWDSFKLR